MQRHIQYIFYSQQTTQSTLLKKPEDVSKSLNLKVWKFILIKTNRNKTEGIWLGKLKNSRDKYENLNCSKQVKSLGIYFGCY